MMQPRACRGILICPRCRTRSRGHVVRVVYVGSAEVQFFWCVRSARVTINNKRRIRARLDVSTTCMVLVVSKPVAVCSPLPSRCQILIGLIDRPLSVASTTNKVSNSGVLLIRSSHHSDYPIPPLASPHFLAALSIPMESRSGGLLTAKGRLSTREKRTKQNRRMSFMIIARSRDIPR
jgi:hypothetical protein